MKITKALVAGGLIAIVIATILFWSGSTPPFAVVKNGSSVPIVVRFETDVGESYSIGNIAVGGSARVGITGRDKLLWAVAQFADGRVRQSQKLYTTTQGTISVLVTNDAVEINYAL